MKKVKTISEKANRNISKKKEAAKAYNDAIILANEDDDQVTVDLLNKLIVLEEDRTHQYI